MLNTSANLCYLDDIADKSTKLFKFGTNLIVGVAKQRNRWKFVKPSKYSAQIKARVLIIAIWDHSEWDLEVSELVKY